MKGSHGWVNTFGSNLIVWCLHLDASWTCTILAQCNSSGGSAWKWITFPALMLHIVWSLMANFFFCLDKMPFASPFCSQSQLICNCFCCFLFVCFGVVLLCHIYLIFSMSYLFDRSLLIDTLDKAFRDTDDNQIGSLSFRDCPGNPTYKIATYLHSPLSCSISFHISVKYLFVYCLSLSLAVSRHRIVPITVRAHKLSAELINDYLKNTLTCIQVLGLVGSHRGVCFVISYWVVHFSFMRFLHVHILHKILKSLKKA